MGRGIHVYAEKFVNGQWQSLDKWAMQEEDDGQYRYWYVEDSFYEGGRDYGLFNLLGELFPTKGIPTIISPELARVIDNVDWHSHNYVTLAELKAIDIHTKNLEIEGYISLLDYLECEDGIGVIRDCYITCNKLRDDISYIDESEVSNFINGITFNGVPEPKQAIERFLTLTKANNNDLEYFKGIEDLDNNPEWIFYKWLAFYVRVYIKRQLSIVESFPEFFVNTVDKLQEHSNGNDSLVRLVYWFDN